MIREQICVGNLSVCAYLLGDEETREGILIDPAYETDRILKVAALNRLTILKIINTHAHPDHVAGNAAIQRATQAKIYMHENCKKQLDSAFSNYFFTMFGGEPSPAADQYLKDGDLVKFGKYELKVIHTPGHTPGDISLYIEKAVFTGDTLFVGAVGRTDFPGGDLETLQNSIRTRLFKLPDDTVVYPGHNYGCAPTSTIKREKETNPFV